MNNRFSEEEIRTLQNNPNVCKVTTCQIQFTPEFKKRAYESYMNGVSIKEIFMENGIDPKMLGDSRVYSFTYNLRNSAVTDRPFTDRRELNGFKRVAATSEQERIVDLEHQVAYLTQEVEFLKKNLKADTEARKLWESQHLPMSSLS